MSLKTQGQVLSVLMIYIATLHCLGRRFCLSHPNYYFQTLQGNQGSVRSQKATFLSRDMNYFFGWLVSLDGLSLEQYLCKSRFDGEVRIVWENSTSFHTSCRFPLFGWHKSPVLHHVRLVGVWKANRSKCTVLHHALSLPVLWGTECFVGIFLNA